MSIVLLVALQAAPASALPEKFFGMTAQEHAYDVSPEYGEPNWAAMQNAGVQKFRMEIKWNKVVEAGGGNWRTEAAWQGSYDHYIENAAKHGIAILPYIYGRSEGSTQYYQLGDVAFHEFKEFVWTVVQRYGQAGSFWVKLTKNNPSVAQYPVTTWEVWNEPNLPNNCPAKTCNGKEYGEFLVAISNTIHEAQRAIWPSDGSQVLFGGIYLERFNETLHDCAKHWCISNYLASAAQVPGIKTAYDGLSLHSYAFGKPGEHRQYSEKIAAMPSNISEAYIAQANAMGGAKPIWVTEFGWPVAGAEGEAVSAAEQGGLLTEAYNWFRQHSSEYSIRYAAWFDYQDYSNDPNTRWDQHCGLRDVTGWYRPAWYAYEAETGAARWPALSWHSETVPGGIIGDPVVASEGPNQMELVTRGEDEKIYYRSWTYASGWTPWTLVPGSTSKVSSGPGATSWGPNRLDVVARAQDNSVWHWWWDGSWHWEDIPGSITSDPVIVSEGPGQLELIAKGTDNALYYRSWTTVSGWTSWLTVATGTGAVTSGPGATSWGPNRLDVVARAQDNSVWHWWWDGSWHWEDIPGSITSDPALATEGPGQLELTAKGSDGKLYYRSWNSVVGWSGWTNVGGGTGVMTSGPGTVSWGPNRFDVFARADSSNITHWWYGY